MAPWLSSSAVTSSDLTLLQKTPVTSIPSSRLSRGHPYHPPFLLQHCFFHGHANTIVTFTVLNPHLDPLPLQLSAHFTAEALISVAHTIARPTVSSQFQLTPPQRAGHIDRCLFLEALPHLAAGIPPFLPTSVWAPSLTLPPLPINTGEPQCLHSLPGVLC